MSKITNRLAFFAKIKKRSDDLEVYVAKATGKPDVSEQIVAADGHKPFVKREPYVTERNELEIRRSVDYVTPANQAVVVNQDLKERAQKVAKGKLWGASSYLIREVIKEDKDVRGVALMVSGLTEGGITKGTVSRKVQVEGVWTENPGPYAVGTEVKVEFVANQGYRFVSWSDGGLNPHIVTMNDDVILEVTTEEAPTFQGLKLTNTAVSEYITGLTEDPTAQLQFATSVSGDVPYKYLWLTADMSAGGYTESRNPAVDDPIYNQPIVSPEVGTVASYSAPVPISNVLHFQAGTDTGFQSLQYSTDGGTWTNWPEVQGDLNVTFIDAVTPNSINVSWPSSGPDNLYYLGESTEFPSYPYKWANNVRTNRVGYTASATPSAGDTVYIDGMSSTTVTSYSTGTAVRLCYNSDENAWMYIDSGTGHIWTYTTRNPAVGDVLTAQVVPDTNVTVTALHYTSSLVLSPGEGIPTYAYDLPRIIDNTIEWYSTSGTLDHIVVTSADPGLTETVGFYPAGGSPVTASLASIAPAISITCAAYPDTHCLYYLAADGQHYMFSDVFGEGLTLIIGTTSRWPSVGDACMWMTQQGEEGSSTLTDVTITTPSDYGTVTFSNDLYLKGVSDTWYGDDSPNRFWTDGTVNVSGRPSSVITGNDGPADFSQTNNWELSYLFGDFYDDGNWFKVVDASGLDLSQITLGVGTFGSMFESAYFLTTPPALPAITLADDCYDSMFSGCESLTSAPVLPAAILAPNCYNNMFSGCYNINSITCLATDISAENCTVEWLSGVAEEGTFTWALEEGATWPGWTTGESGIPEGWTIEPARPYTVTFSCAHGSVAATVDGMGIQSGDSVLGGKTVIFTITPDAGYEYLGTNPESVVVNADVTKTYTCTALWAGLTFTANQDNSTIKLVQSGSSVSWPIYYSKNGGAWTELSIATSAQYSTTIQLNIGDVVRLKGNHGEFSQGTSRYRYFMMTGSIAASGDVTSLLNNNAGGVTSLTTYGTYTFFKLFYNCTSLTSAPNLPSATLYEQCYSNMFYGCSSLTSAPVISASTLAWDCCAYMFSGCTSLATPPALPAMTLANGCYDHMFYGCTFTQAPALPATVLYDACYQSMFQNNTHLTTPPVISATTLADGCFNGMFDSCSNLASAPALPVTTLVTNCYKRMFYGCTMLVGPVNISATSPYLSGTEASACGNMFTNAGTAGGGVIKVGGNVSLWNSANCGIDSAYWTVEQL